MSNDAIYWAAMYISEIWAAGFNDTRNSERFRTYCRVRSVVLFDRIMLGRIKVTK